jgi:hypothetical protein
MASNSSSMVISFSIAILLLLILLLLLSYNSKSKRDNNEQFNNMNFDSLKELNPLNTFNSFTESINKNLNINDGFYNKDKKEKFESMASFDPYAKASVINKPTNGIEGKEDNINTYASINGEGYDNKYMNLEKFENQATQDPTTCIKKEKLTSKDLLPKDAQDLIWSKMNPSSQANIDDQNFLTAGYHIGVNTIGQSLRNANLQLRSEIPNPQVAVSPWLISTIEPDVRSTTLEIGSSPSY